MSFLKRLYYYSTGFIIGIFFLFFIFNGKRTSCNYGPSARVIDNIISKELTDLNFNKGASYILLNLNIFSLFSGTHNEESIYKIIDIMKSHNVDYGNQKIWFGQLYGMSDNISFNLANEGFNAIKYLPFGPIKEVIPYLIRRADENTSVKGQTSRELELIKTELKRRKTT